MFWSFAPHREGDQPQVLHPEGSAAVVSGQLLPIHRLSDNTALQQGSGVDHLLQARVSVPLAGAFKQTRTHADILHAQSDPICTLSVDHLLPYSVSTQAFFPPHLVALVLPQLLCILHEAITGAIADIWITVKDSSSAHITLLVWHSDYRLLNRCLLHVHLHAH